MLLQTVFNQNHIQCRGYAHNRRTQRNRNCKSDNSVNDTATGLAGQCIGIVFTKLLFFQKANDHKQRCGKRAKCYTQNTTASKVYRIADVQAKDHHNYNGKSHQFKTGFDHLKISAGAHIFISLEKSFDDGRNGYKENSGRDHSDTIVNGTATLKQFGNRLYQQHHQYRQYSAHNTKYPQRILQNPTGFVGAPFCHRFTDHFGNGNRNTGGGKNEQQSINLITVVIVVGTCGPQEVIQRYFINRANHLTERIGNGKDEGSA